MLNRNGENCLEKWKGLSLIILDPFVIVHQVQNCDIGGHFQNLLQQLCHCTSNICELKYFAKLPQLAVQVDRPWLIRVRIFIYLISVFFNIFNFHFQLDNFTTTKRDAGSKFNNFKISKMISKLPSGCSGRSTLIDPSSAAIFPPSKLLSGEGKILLK